MNEKTGDTTWQPDGSGGVQPQRVGGGSRSSQLPQDLIREAPADGSPYARQDNGWVLVPAPEVGEAPQDGGLYLRGNGGWALYTPPSGGVEEAPQDGSLYARKDAAWQRAIEDVPVDSKYYARRNMGWSDFEPLPNGSTNRTLVYGSTGPTWAKAPSLLAVEWRRSSRSLSAGSVTAISWISGSTEWGSTSPSLVDRSSSTLTVNYAGMMLVEVAVTDWGTNNDDNRMIELLKDGSTYQRFNSGGSRHTASNFVTLVPTVDGTQLVVNLRCGVSTTASGIAIRIVYLGYGW